MTHRAKGNARKKLKAVERRALSIEVFG